MNFENLMFRNTDLSNVYGNSYGCNNFSGNTFGSILSGMFMGGYGNSIFGCMGGYNYGYGSSCCGDVSNALKFQLGNTLGSFAVMIGGHYINKAIQNKQTNSLDTKLESKNNEINKELKKLGDGVTEANYINHNAADEKVYADRQTEINKSNDELNATLEKLGEKVSDGQIKKLENDLANLDKDSETYAEDYDRINDEIKAAKEKNKQIDEIEKQLENNKKKQAELDKDIETRQKEIDKVIDKIQNLIKERDTIQAKIKEENDTKITEKADGTALGRKDITKAAEIADDGTVTLKNNKESLEEGHVKDLIRLYRSSTSENDKKKYGKAIINIYENGLAKITPSYKKTLESFISIVKNDLGQS